MGKGNVEAKRCGKMRAEARLLFPKRKAKPLALATAAPKTARCQNGPLIGTRKHEPCFSVSKEYHFAYRNPAAVRNLRPNSFSNT